MKYLLAVLLITQTFLSGVNALEMKSIPGPKYSDGTFAVIGQIMFDKNELMIVRGVYAIFLSSNRGQSWTSTSPFGITGDSFYDMIFDTSGNLLVGTQRGVFRREGNTWKDLNDLLPNGKVLTVGVTQTGTIYICFNDNNVYVSKDNGQYWTKKNTGLTHDNFNFSPEFYPGYDDKMYFAADGKIWTSTDESSAWTQTVNGVPRLSLVNDSISYMNRSGLGFYVSKDRGKTYTKQNINTYAVLAEDRYGKLYADEYDETYMLVSNDQGKTWKKEYTTIEVARQVAFDSMNFMFASVYTQGGSTGLWRSILPLDVDDHATAPATSIFPNPASTFLTIQLKSPLQSNTDFALYDDRGVLVLSSSQLFLHGSEAILDVSQLPAGTYFCRLKTGAFIETRKIVLTR